MRPLNLEFRKDRYASVMGWALLSIGLLLMAGSLLAGLGLSAETTRLRGELPVSAESSSTTETVVGALVSMA